MTVSESVEIIKKYWDTEMSEDEFYKFHCAQNKITNAIVNDGYIIIKPDELLNIESMRDATKEEINSTNEYIKRISVPTGFNFYDFYDIEIKSWITSPKDDSVICPYCSNEHYLGSYREYAADFCPKCGKRVKL
jgi:formylmethanofuran dehydrogenase subunit E